MTLKDSKPESEPFEEADPLSATGMFLRAFGTESDQPKKQSEVIVAKPADLPEPKQAAPSADRVFASSPRSSPAGSEAVESQPGSAGEFTRLFQTPEPAKAPPRQTWADQPPSEIAEPKQTPAPAPGEFTRIFVKIADPPPTPPARTIPDPPPPTHSASSPPRLKGFSSPGVSDSASAEGSFTQFFKARPSVTAPAPHVQAFSPPTPSPTAPAEEFKWPQESDSSAGERLADRAPDSSSATGMVSSLVSSGRSHADLKAQPAEPLPSYYPAPSGDASAADSGSVTRLIQRLSEGTRPTPKVEAPQPSPEAAELPSSQVSSEPGDFTRMISGSAIKAAISAPAPPVAAPPAQPIPISIAAPPLAMPHAPVPAVAGAALHAPKIQLPPVAAPPLAPAAVPPVKSKLQEMLPILLVVNTFLLIVLIVVVIFALKAK